MLKLTKEIFIEKAIKKHNVVYDYSLVNYINGSIKVNIICKNHGIFSMRPKEHLLGQGCIKCSCKGMDTKKFIMLSQLKHKNKYDYSKVKYINANTKIKIICKKHGEWECIPGPHYLRGVGCNECANKKGGVDVFVKKANNIHNNFYNYNKVKYKNSNSNVIVTCPNHGDFLTKPVQHIAGRKCPKCIKGSYGEHLIKEFLLNNNIEFIPQFRFKNCKYKNPLPFDFYLPKQNLCIEFDGNQHKYNSVLFEKRNGGLKEIQMKDSIKNNFCKTQNIKLLRIPYNKLNKITELLTNNILT